MTARVLVLLLLATLGFAASWLLGYQMGQRTGAFHLLYEMGEQEGIDYKAAKDESRDQVCNEIRRYKLSMAKDLDENTQICGWSDMDGPEISH
jgi:hypothetical protein